MRIAGLLLLSSLAVGCGGPACRDHTLLLSFSLASGVSADALSITVDVAGSAKVSPLALKSGTTNGTIEIDFPGGYPSGSAVDVSISATSGGVQTGTGSKSVTATGSCQKLSITISAGQPSNAQDMTLAAADMSPVANKHQGDACGPTDVCDTGKCIDGYCCNDTCGGQCQACDVVGKLGMCTTTTDGIPHGSRTACTGSGTCGGACTGASATVCTYPTTTVICGAACDGHCDGAGGCSSTAGGMCPNGFACGASGCDTTCATDGDCQPNFHCAAPSCVRDVESDCLDGKDNNGDGLADCQDPTCTSMVQCVPGAPAGDELGIEQAAGSTCPTTFGLSEAQNQGLNAPACDTSGCGCNAYVTCDVSLAITSSTSCSPRTTLATQRIEQRVGASNTEAPTVAPCATIQTTATNGFFLNSNNYVSARCTATGTKSPTAPSWTGSETFCATNRTSATCASSAQVCAAIPPAASPICVRVPSAAASCPAGYTTGKSATWYASYMDSRACTCDCDAPTNGACGPYVDNAFYSGSTCPIPTTGPQGSCALEVGMCDVTGGEYAWGFCILSSNESVSAVAVTAADVSGTCNTKVDNSGTATPTEGSTICCQ